MLTRFEFSKSSVEVEVRGTYVYAVAKGVLASTREVAEFYRLVQQRLDRLASRRLLIDARGQTAEPTAEIKQTAWDRLVALSLERVAYVVGDDAMKVTRVNMTALSGHVPLRAFQSFLEAHRWLTAPPKTVT